MTTQSTNKVPQVGLALYEDAFISGTGTQRFSIELARGLLALDQRDVEYLVLLKEGVDPGTVKFPLDRCRWSPGPSFGLFSRIRRRLHRGWFAFACGLRLLFGMEPEIRHLGKLWVKDWLRSLNLDLLYLPSAWMHELVPNLPVVVTIHDIQHAHFPQWWKEDEFQRKVVFEWFARNAELVTCSFDHVAKDLVGRLSIRPDKVRVIANAPPTQSEELTIEPAEIRRRFKLPERFFLYPAATWPSKNHMNLVRALSICRERHLDIWCVCTGDHSDRLYPGEFKRIQDEMQARAVSDRIQFLGSVTYDELRTIQQMADFFCIPTLYEAGSYPVWEASALGKAVACSDVTSLPFQIQDCGLLFEPTNPHDIADAIQVLWTNSELRSTLGKKAKEHLGDYRVAQRNMALGYHRAFLDCLIDLGRLDQRHRILRDPATPIDATPFPVRLDWKRYLNSNADMLAKSRD